MRDVDTRFELQSLTQIRNASLRVAYSYKHTQRAMPYCARTRRCQITAPCESSILIGVCKRSGFSKRCRR